MDPVDLEELIDRELRRLPQPRAPRSLLPNVLAAADRWSARPWYTRAWTNWPRGWQVASAAVASIAILGLAWLVGSVGAAANVAAASPALASTTETIQRISSLVSGVETTAGAARVVWLALVQPVVIYAFAFVAVMFSACVVLGIAINRVLFGKVFQS
jgi:hypothetical protein